MCVGPGGQQVLLCRSGHRPCYIVLVLFTRPTLTSKSFAFYTLLKAVRFLYKRISLRVCDMAGPGGKFFIQEKLGVKAAHHESFERLWETKWKEPVSLPCTLSP